MTTITDYKTQLSRASTKEVLEHFELYNDLKSLGVKDTVILGLLEAELDRRGEFSPFATVNS
jgi:hypothetical protein